MLKLCQRRRQSHSVKDDVLNRKRMVETCLKTSRVQLTRAQRTSLELLLN
jgi:hypothetical protein